MNTHMLACVRALTFQCYLAELVMKYHWLKGMLDSGAQGSCRVAWGEEKTETRLEEFVQHCSVWKWHYIHCLQNENITLEIAWRYTRSDTQLTGQIRIKVPVLIPKHYNRQLNCSWTWKPAIYLVKGFPLKSATCRALQYEMLSGISIISARNTDKLKHPSSPLRPHKVLSCTWQVEKVQWAGVNKACQMLRLGRVILLVIDDRAVLPAAMVH